MITTDMERSQTNLSLLMVAIVALSLLVAVCDRAKGQPSGMMVGFFQHSGDNADTFLRFTPVPTPGKTIYVVQTWKVHKRTGECAYRANRIDWLESAIRFPRSDIVWEYQFDMRTETLTVHFPNSTRVFFRAEPHRNPARYCSQSEQDT